MSISTLMNSKELAALFAETTKLKKDQIKELVPLIIDYDESDELAYEVIGLLGEDISFSSLKNDIIEERFGWRGKPFTEFREARVFRDKALANPPKPREGEIECPKCGKKQTSVVEMQTRSADEGFTYFIHCLNDKCKKISKMR